MNPSELRIGNKIRANVVYEGNLKTFHHFNEHLTVAFFSDGSSSGIGEYLEDCSEEPLTIEWLKKIDWNGYKYLYINSNFCLDEEGHLYYSGDYTGINVEYVHQLQNLYSNLKGEELQFKA